MEEKKDFLVEIGEIITLFSKNEKGYHKKLSDYFAELEDNLLEKEIQKEGAYMKIDPLFFNKRLKDSQEIFPFIVHTIKNSSRHLVVESGAYQLELDPFISGIVISKYETNNIARAISDSSGKEGGLAFVNLVGRRGLSRILNLFDALAGFWDIGSNL
mgnify:CR=1 FL=1